MRTKPRLNHLAKSNNSTGRENLPELIQSVFDKLAALASDEPAPTELTPTVPIKKSITDDYNEYIVCLEDGKKLKMLKRHLMTAYGMTPEEYRARWGLKADYPMVRRTTQGSGRSWPRRSGLGGSRASSSRSPRPRPGGRVQRRLLERGISDPPNVGGPIAWELKRSGASPNHG